MSRARLITCVLLPFAAGYYLSYLFRTINALIANDLTAELGLGAADLGLLTSVYFLVFAAAQLPFGILLDRHGPRTIQSVLLLLASTGALVFALADGLVGLVIGRALIGLGVALALMAGFKAIVLWFPADRIALVNGWFVMLGALGAVTATAPAELIVLAVGWRGLFALLAAFSAVAALLLLVFVPDACSNVCTAKTPQSISLCTIYTRPALLAHRAAVRSGGRDIVVPAGPLGSALAERRRGLRSRHNRSALERHGRGGQRERASARSCRRSAAPIRCPNRAGPRLQPGAVNGGAARTGRWLPGALISGVGHHCCSRRRHRAQLRYSWELLSQGGLRPRQRGAQPLACGCRFRPAVCDGPHYRPVAGGR